MGPAPVYTAGFFPGVLAAGIMADGGTGLSKRFAGFGVYFKAPVLAVFPLGFVAGLPLALTSATLSLWMRREGISLTAIGFLSLVGTPYALKFLWAPIIDRLPLPALTRLFGRRRGWMALILVLLAAAIAGLGIAGTSSNPPDLGLVAVFAFATTFLSASFDIVLDAFRIESMERDDLAAGAAMYVYGYRLGLLAAGAGALYIHDSFSWLAAYGTMAVLVGIGFITVLLRPEPEFRESPEVAAATAKAERYLSSRPHLSGRGADIIAWFYVAVIEPFAEFMGRRGWLLLLLFATVFKFGDALAGVMTPPFLADLGFTDLEIADVSKLFGFVALLAGLGVCGALMSRYGMIPILWVAGILQLLSNGVFAILAVTGHNIPMLVVTIGFENFASGLGTAAFLAYLSSLCNVSFTATQYALLSSLFAFARTWLTSPSGFFAENLGWLNFFLFTMLAALPGLVLLWFIQRRQPASQTS